MKTQKIDNGLYRLLIPFDNLTTTVYIAVFDTGAAIIDAATYPEDVDNYIIPALAELGIDTDAVKYIFLTHRHGDHAGGLARICELLQKAQVYAYHADPERNILPLSDGDVKLGGLMSVHLPGHTADSMGYLDLRSHTLLSGDCLQLKGIGKYRNGIGNKDTYIASVNKLRAIDVRRIVAAHEYDPLGSIAEGRAAVDAYLDLCLAVI